MFYAFWVIVGGIAWWYALAVWGRASDHGQLLDTLTWWEEAALYLIPALLGGALCLIPALVAFLWERNRWTP